MWYVLIVMLFSTDPQAKPALLEPVAFTSEAKCQAAGEATLEAVKEAKLDSVAGVVLACRAMSNPVTEHSAENTP